MVRKVLRLEALLMLLFGGTADQSDGWMLEAHHEFATKSLATDI